MDWMLLWAQVATVTALWFGLSYRRERARVAFWREQAGVWRDRAYEEETLREPPFLAPAFERIEPGQLVVVRTDGKVGLAAGGRTDGAA